MDGTIMNCKCGNDKFYIKQVTFVNETKHVGAYCDSCGKNLQWLQNPEKQKEEGLIQAGEIVVNFGKHKGIKLKDMPKEYASWVLSTSKIGSFWQKQIKAVFDDLK